MSLLEVRDLEVEFNSKEQYIKAVQGLSLEIEAGEIVGLVGASGSGKSISMMAILGLLNPKIAHISGIAFFDGKKSNLAKATSPSKIAMIFQDALTCLNPTMTIGEQILETIMIHKRCKKKEAKNKAIELLEQVGIRFPKRCMKQYPFALSGGMLQRVVIVIALACEPKLIIADEPTTALDVTIQAQILKLMKCISKEMGVAILLVSHDMGVIANLCERVLVMEQGRIIESGTVEDIFYHPKEAYTQGLLAANRMVDDKEWDGSQNQVLLKVDSVVKHYDTKAVNGVDFTIHEGETLGLVGESSCGKSTIARMITGIRKPDEGAIYFRGVRIDHLKNKEWMPYRQKIQMIFQNPFASLNPRMTVGEIIEEPMRANNIGDKVERSVAVADILKAVGLEAEYADRYPSEFSGGQRQRIGIARALIVNPELVICDEPLSALDVSIRDQIIQLLGEFQKKQGLSYLFIAHDLEMIRSISQRVGVMCLGTIVEMGNTKEIYEDPWHPYTKTLLSASLVADPKLARKKKKVLFRGIESTGDITRREMVQSCRKRFQKEDACPFSKDCRYALEVCHREVPKSYVYGTRRVACFLYSDQFAKKKDENYKMTSQI